MGWHTQMNQQNLSTILEGTQKGNFAEVFLAEYLEETTDTRMPVYKLKYNPNSDQLMKGDDVLLFDLDSEPISGNI